MTAEDNELLGKLYLEYSGKMIKWAYTLLRSESIAMELVNETFVTLMTKIDEVRTHPNLVGWLFVTLRYQIRNELDKARYRLELPFDESLAVGSDFTENLCLADCLPAELSEEEKNLIIWHYEERCSHEEMAKRLGISINACRTRLFRAKEHYKKINGWDHSL